ncbi:Transglycosylase-like domain-containing protein [Pedococcus dokdonensis]|uniref:Transglycosylase-like domain-containing protein n=1 Tax=Pedococcus dokdonensis TaxID=443156 RepID=A0A1H0SSA1_9MICO|nr:transglycosylase family protein [Pedococcus dokdonensis]SDP44449.1 Transglycosylase-like domain-containing protein [Pedococcus dokdonensis]
MFYAPKHSARKAKPVRRRVTGVAVAGVATVAGGMATATSAQASTVWDRVAACESGGNWSINTGNGYYGGLQFSDRTWDGFGGERYAATANRATKAEQITIAQKVLASQGPGAWPTCGARAGLTRANGAAVNARTTTSTASRSTTRKAPAVSHRAGKLVVDGIRGPKTNAAIERWVGGSVNGTLSRTDVKALQRKVGSAPDGIIGPRTVRALQTKIGARHNGARHLDRATVRTLQSYLNAR